MGSTELITMKKGVPQRLTKELGDCGWSWSYPGDASRHHGLETYYSFVPKKAPETETNLYRHARYYLFTGNNQPRNIAEFGVAFEALSDDGSEDAGSPFGRFRRLMGNPGWRAWLADMAGELGLQMRFTYGGIGTGTPVGSAASLHPDALNRGITTAADGGAGWTGVFLSRHAPQQDLVSQPEPFAKTALWLFPLLSATKPHPSP